MYDVSVVITTNNRDEHLEFFFKRIKEVVNPNTKIQFIIADDSKDLSPSTIKICEDNNAVYTHSGFNKKYDWRPPSFAINFSVETLVKAPVFIITCPEIYLMEDCITAMVEEHKKRDKITTITLGKYDKSGILWNALKEKKVLDMSDYFRGEMELRTNMPFFMGMKTEHFKAIGGYDLDFLDGIAYDDDDFSRRIKAYGCEINKMNNNHIIHLWHGHYLNKYNETGIPERWTRNKNLCEKNSREGKIVANEGKLI